jgi:excisionase family DNA binding protein
LLCDGVSDRLNLIVANDFLLESLRPNQPRQQGPRVVQSYCRHLAPICRARINRFRGIFSHVADELTVSEAAIELGTSRQSILNFLGDGTLSGAKTSSGIWRIRRQSVDRFLKQYGRLNGGRRRKSAATLLDEEARDLRDQLEQLTTLSGDGDTVPRLLAERDELRGQVAVLEDSLARLREASELQRRADAERARVIDGLLSALGAAERADALRRQAVEVLEDGVAASLMPRHPG